MRTWTAVDFSALTNTCGGHRRSALLTDKSRALHVCPVRAPADRRSWGHRTEALSATDGHDEWDRLPWLQVGRPMRSPKPGALVLGPTVLIRDWN